MHIAVISIAVVGFILVFRTKRKLLQQQDHYTEPGKFVDQISVNWLCSSQGHIVGCERLSAPCVYLSMLSSP